MKLIWLWIVSFGFSIMFNLLLHTDIVAQEISLKYQTYELPQTLIHTLLIGKNSQFLVSTAKAETLATVAEFSEKERAIAVLNGGFFDPKNQKSTSYVIQQGKIIADPKDNERLINNPDLTSYLKQILNRSEFRRYQCQSHTRYDITRHDEPIPVGCSLVDAIGGGPSLVPDLTGVSEGFLAYDQGKLIRDALGSEQPNARTAIALTPTGDVLWIMAEQKSDFPGASGLSLTELADFCRRLGVKKALNLDGGSSSSFYWDGDSYYGKVSSHGEKIKRPIKSVLLVK